MSCCCTDNCGCDTVYSELQEAQPTTVYLLVDPGVKLPVSAYESNSVDIPFRISKECFLVENYTYHIPTGVRVYTDCVDTYLMPRSSCGLLDKVQVVNQDTVGLPDSIIAYERSSLHMENTFGLIDRDYKGELQARIYLVGAPYQLSPNKFYLQLTAPQTVRWVVTTDVRDIPPAFLNSSRGEGGFGSSTK
jgi:dUTPase